jgi:hypothetical protein
MFTMPTTDPYAKENLVHNLTRYFLKVHFNIMLISTNVSNKYTSSQIKSRLLLKHEITQYVYITEEIGLYAKFCAHICINSFERVHCVSFPNISVEPNMKYPFISPYIHNRRHYVPPHDLILIICVSFNA